MPASATVTVCFTDVVRSTELRTGRGDASAHGTMQAHFRLIRQQVQRHGGQEIKTIGDSFMIAFGSARKAVEWAVGVQRAITRQGIASPRQRVGVRIGINTGEAISDEGDLFGSAVDAAHRIMSKAQGGQILVSEIVRGVVGAATDIEFVERGRFRLKGFPQSWRLYEVPWQTSRVASPPLVLTFLFTDIAGSSAITERLGEREWVELIRAHNAIVRSQLAAHSAFAVKSLGDGFMVAFQDASSALQCAIAIQRGFANYNVEHPEDPIHVRIGLHTGEAIEEGDDFYGNAVISAARIANRAQGRETLVTNTTKELVNSAEFVLEDRGEQSLKGVGEPVRVWALRETQKPRTENR